MKQRATYIAQSWDFVSVWAIHDTDDYPLLFSKDYEFCREVPQQSTPPFATGFSSDGTAAKPYPLCTKAQMQHVASTSSLWTKQFRLMGDIDLTGMTGTIGNSGTTFSGVFDGNDHTLSKFSYTTTAQYAGLFGRVNNTNGGTIKNLTIEDFTVAGVGYVGALVGYHASGLIDNVKALNPVVQMSGDTTALYEGGLVGRCGGTVSNSIANGTVSATAYKHIGGLVGRLEPAGIITKSASSGSVSMSCTDTTAQEVGGLVGRSYGQVLDSYSSAVVQSNRNYSGGLIGVMSAGALTQNCYATGSVSAESVAGGLVATSSASIVDSWASGNATAVSTYAGGLVGTSGDGSSITNCHAIGNVKSNGTTGGLAGQISGTCVVADSSASGNVVSTSTYGGGLVGRSDTGPTIRDSFATGSVISDSRSGGLLGAATSSTAVYTSVLRSYATGTVAGGSYLGGLVGLGTYVNVTESWASGDVTQSAFAYSGGLVGYLYNGSTVTNSFAWGDVYSLGNGGGLVGTLAHTAAITNSYSAGAVTGTGSYIGALIGYNESTPTYSGVLWNTSANSGLSAIGGGTTTATGITGYTDAQLKQQATYTAKGWNFTTIWTIAEGVGYAELR
jgi:hypothetical protein